MVKRNQRDVKSSHTIELECNLGCFTHLGVVILIMHHFLSRVRELQEHSKNRRSVPIENSSKSNLHLMLHFLEVAHDGVSMTYIAFQKPTYVNLLPGWAQGIQS